MTDLLVLDQFQICLLASIDTKNRDQVGPVDKRVCINTCIILYTVPVLSDMKNVCRLHIFNHSSTIHNPLNTRKRYPFYTQVNYRWRRRHLEGK